jgi:DNA polymerase
MFLEPDAAPEVWNVLYHYCKVDVKTEELLDESLPDLIPAEQEIWQLNQKLNWRGLPIDIPTVQKITKIMNVESKKKLKELDALTMGLVTKPGARKSILEFLALDDIILPDIRATTVEDVLKRGDLNEDMRRLLEIRKALSKTSTRKYQSFLDRAMPDGRVRDILLYHGASTGRDTGTGIQPHNFPRGVISVDKNRPYEPVENVIECDEDVLKILYGETLPMVFSSILRNMIIPAPGKEMFVADFSKIEVAVLWWLADNEPGLKILREGKDPYIYQASANLGQAYEEIEAAVFKEEKWALDARQLGKAQVLGCGFGMGWEKFQTTAWAQYRLKLTDEQSILAVKKYRTQNVAVKELWYDYAQAVIDMYMFGAPGPIKVGNCTFIKGKGFLWIELPSGRRLAYREPQVIEKQIPIKRRALVDPTNKILAYRNSAGERETEDDRKKKLEIYNELKKRPGVTETTVIEMSKPKPVIEFWAVNSKTKVWSIERTWGGTFTENVVQAVARDLMMPAMVRLEKHGYEAMLMVHDEGLAQKKIGEGSVEEFIKILCERPTWADENLIVEAKGWKGPRYRK